MSSNLQKSGFGQLLFLDYSAFSDCFSGYSVHLLQTTISTRSSVRQKNGHWLLTAKHAWLLRNGLTWLEDNSESVSMQKSKKCCHWVLHFDGQLPIFICPYSSSGIACKIQPLPKHPTHISHFEFWITLQHCQWWAAALQLWHTYIHTLFV